MDQLLRFHRNSFFIAFAVFVVSAWVGTGFFHADEHYQIIEFANSRLTAYSSHEYAWEFEAASRSALQPFMAFVIFKLFSWFSVTDPYFLAFTLRFITAVTALLLIRRFVFMTLDKLNPVLKKPFILVSYFFWIIPFVNVRFSSEVWAGIALLAAVIFLMKEEKVSVRTAFLGGIAIGFSFLFRFQMGAVVLGIFFWLLIIAKPGFRAIGAYIGGCSLVFCLGVLIDYWFYGKFVLSSWNYFDLQILQSVAAGFGETAWYEYFSIILFASGWPAGILVLVSLIWFLIRNPAHMLSWIMVSFLLLHMLVGHKEERFLFPLVNFVPFLLIFLVEDLRLITGLTLSQKWKKALIVVLLLPFIAINTIGLAVTLSKSAGSGGISVTQFIHRNYAEAPVKLIHTAYSSPFSPFDSAPLKFYAEKNVSSQKIDRLCGLTDSILQSSDTALLFSMRRIEHSDPECEAILKKTGLKKIHTSVPAWILKVDQYVDVIKEDDVIELYSK